VVPYRAHNPPPFGNTIKFTHEGEVVAKIELDSRTEDDVFLHFRETIKQMPSQAGSTMLCGQNHAGHAARSFLPEAYGGAPISFPLYRPSEISAS
jgi:hypothetical protein